VQYRKNNLAGWQDSGKAKGQRTRRVGAMSGHGSTLTDSVRRPDQHENLSSTRYRSADTRANFIIISIWITPAQCRLPASCQWQTRWTACRFTGSRFASDDRRGAL